VATCFLVGLPAENSDVGRVNHEAAAKSPTTAH
jgi:hypothetical protein